nr:CPBP family intramembrane glutamic endopeptidase [Priestia taiwanensis]
MLLGVFIHMLLGGPLGEELGWRSYVLTDLQQTCSPLKSAIIVGILWGFWHTPLWFLSGYGGMQLVQYIICFMVSIIATSIIMTTFYNINRNLVIPIIIHQLFNYFMTIQIGNRVDIFVSTAILYVIAAVALILINYKQSLYKRNI